MFCYEFDHNHCIDWHMRSTLVDTNLIALLVLNWFFSTVKVSDEVDGRSSAKSLQRNGVPGAMSRVPGLHGDGALYGSGKSTFYVNPDSGSYQTSTESIPRVVDPSIYLANSTFYRDRVPDLVVPVPKNHVDPMPIVPVAQLRSSTPDLGSKPPIRKKPILPMSPLNLPRYLDSKELRSINVFALIAICILQFIFWSAVKL